MKTPYHAFLLSLGLCLLPARGEILARGPFAGLDLDVAPADVRPMIVAANEDCIEVSEYRLPKNAEPYPMVIQDGGSRAYIGVGYVILVRQSLVCVAPGPITGYSYGYELYFGTYAKFSENPGAHPWVSKVWFVSKDKIDAVEKANAAALKARMPPLEKYIQLRPKNEANQALEPTPTTVTPPAGQEARQP